MTTQVSAETTKNKGGAPLGNQNARKGGAFRACLEAIVREDRRENLYKGMKAMYRLAGTGDLKALEFIRDTLDGKPAQAIQVTGEDGGPVQIHARPMITAEQWLSIFAPGLANVIEGQVERIEDKRPDGQ